MREQIFNHLLALIMNAHAYMMFNVQQEYESILLPPQTNLIFH